jgi:hypothetical protein
MAEPPYGVIWKDIMAGRVVPFLGAGASFVGRSPDVEWNPREPEFLPSGPELSRYLAKESSFPSQDLHDIDDLARVSSYYTIVSGRRRLRRILREKLNGEFTYGPLHQYLASIPAPLLIVSTNYDTLIEQAFQAADKHYDLVIHPSEGKDFDNAILWWRHSNKEPRIIPPNELEIDLEQTTVIYKMHGSIQRESDSWDNFVITEEDYVDFLSRMTTNTAIPSLFYKHFRTRSFLFLGYSLRDWNLRVVLKNLDRYLTRRRGGSYDEDESLPSWSIQHKPSELERTLWEKRNVNIFDMALDKFVDKLRQWK